jgi:hypothetical protein
MSTRATPAGPGFLRIRALSGFALLEREAPLTAAVAVYLALIAAALPQMLVQDSWLTLAAGREIVQHGLPHTDSLTVWSQGKPWTDQQWLAQVLFYALDRAGGIRLVMLAHALFVSGAFAVGIAAARARGASHKSVIMVATVCSLVAPWGLQMRAQSIAPLLFVALFWLLLADARRPGRRVLFVLPILVLWANIHGTVLLGALLVLVRGLTRLGQSRRGRPVSESLLLLAAPALVLVSPYGWAMVGYYRQMLVSSQLRTYVEEWQVSTPSPRTAGFYLVAFGATALVARQARSINRFELISLVILLVSAVTAIRSILWFGLACTVILPALVDRELPTGAWRALVPARWLAGAGLAIVALVACMAATRPAAWFERAWPTQGLGTVSRALATSDTRVIADDRHSDWLLWKLPQLRGRLANDVRFELYGSRQLAQLAAFSGASDVGWRAAGRGYGLVVLDAHALPKGGAKLYGTPVFRGSDMIVVRSGRRAARPR